MSSPRPRRNKQRGGAVHHDAGGGDQDHRALHHRHRGEQPLHRLHADRTDADQQDRGVQQRRQDGAAPPAIGAPACRWKTREPGGAPAEQQAQHVAEIVRRIRQQRHRVGRQAKGDLGRDEADVQGRADGEGAIVTLPMMRCHGARGARGRGDGAPCACDMPGNVALGQCGASPAPPRPPCRIPHLRSGTRHERATGHRHRHPARCHRTVPGQQPWSRRRAAGAAALAARSALARVPAVPGDAASRHRNRSAAVLLARLVVAGDRRAGAWPRRIRSPRAGACSR